MAILIKEGVGDTANKIKSNADKNRFCFLCIAQFRNFMALDHLAALLHKTILLTAFVFYRPCRWSTTLYPRAGKPSSSC